MRGAGGDGENRQGEAREGKSFGHATIPIDPFPDNCVVLLHSNPLLVPLGEAQELGELRN